jgi:hypothetical protein
MWLDAANGAHSERERYHRPKRCIERQEDMVSVGRVLGADDNMPGVRTGCGSGSKQYRWD